MIAVCYLIVPPAGLEPARLAADAPKAPVSTQFHHEGIAPPSVTIGDPRIFSPLHRPSLLERHNRDSFLFRKVELRIAVRISLVHREGVEPSVSTLSEWQTNQSLCLWI